MSESLQMPKAAIDELIATLTAMAVGAIVFDQHPRQVLELGSIYVWSDRSPLRCCSEAILEKLDRHNPIRGTGRLAISLPSNRVLNPPGSSGLSLAGTLVNVGRPKLGLIRRTWWPSFF
jgi:hypothetical protein